MPEGKDAEEDDEDEDEIAAVAMDERADRTCDCNGNVSERYCV